jgi:hypothetical protein
MPDHGMSSISEESQPMTSPNQQLLSTAVSGGGGPLSKTFLFARVAAICAAIAGAMPTAMNLYQSWTHGIPYSEVSHRLSQYDLWVKNFECKIDYRALNTSQGTRIDVGACPKSGDIAIKLSATSGKATYEWIPFEKLQKASASLWHLEFLVGTAHAAQPGLSDIPPPSVSQPRAPAPFAQLAQATSGMQVVCEALQGKSVLRIVNDGGKCYREMISPYQGKVDKREEVPCTTTCKPAAAAGK